MKQKATPIGTEHMQAWEAAIRADERRKASAKINEIIKIAYSLLPYSEAELTVLKPIAKPAPRRRKAVAITEEQVAEVETILRAWKNSYGYDAKVKDIWQSCHQGMTRSVVSGCLRDLVAQGKTTVDSQGRYRIVEHADETAAEQA